MKKIIATDFDGTLTTRDTLVEFIRFARGNGRCLMGFLLFSPLIVLMRLHLYPNWKAKQRLFSHFFRGMTIEEFSSLGCSFALKIDAIRRDDTLARIAKLQDEGVERVYVVSASIEQWVRPWCEERGFEVIATQVEVSSSGILTGRFASPNCYGEEKVRRLRAVEPDRHDYTLYAFGDSHGDDALLAYADQGWRV